MRKQELTLDTYSNFFHITKLVVMKPELYSESALLQSLCSPLHNNHYCSESSPFTAQTLSSLWMSAAELSPAPA